MADLFGRAADSFGGAFSADSAKITFAEDTGAFGAVAGGAALAALGGGVGMLTQQLSFSYQQQVTRIYEIGTNFSFYVAGRTQGSLSMGRVIGPRPVAVAFYRKFGSVCQAATNTLNIQLATGCQDPGQFAQVYAFSLKFCVITSIGVSINAQDMMINEQLQLMFASLNLNGIA